jgi:serine/threonine protein kinase/WD40 repeat protein
MSNPSLERVEELFHQAVELKPRERARFLDAHCQGDPALRAAVETLLKYDQELGSTIDVMASPIQRSPSEIFADARTLRARAESPPSGGVPHPCKIPGYEIIDELGRGGMGIVYKARQLGLNRLVALKMLLSAAPVTPESLARFRIEAETLGRLQHPNIVRIYEIGEHEGLPYFVMEYIDGPSLAQQMAGMPQPPRAAAYLVEILARAMSAVHRCGIIHRDLKPANILLVSDGLASGEWRSETRAGGETTEATPGAGLQSAATLPPAPRTSTPGPLAPSYPKITDFGLAKRIEDPGAVTRTGSVMGTPDYMAPEQARGDTSAFGPWTDIYALGAILYEMVTGRPPFQGASPAETLARVLDNEPVSPTWWRAGLPRDLETICLKCLEKDRQRRYSNALELAEDLRRFQAGEPIKARPIGVLGRTWRWCRRQPVAAAALAAAGALGLALVITVLVYNARLQEALTREHALAEERRSQLVQADVNLGTHELENGDAFAALLWLTEAMRLDRANLEHRQRILRVMNQVPWLLEFGTCNGKVLASHCTRSDCWLALQGSDHSVRVWDVRTKEYLGPALPHQAGVYLAQFSPNGRYLATASEDGRVLLWQWNGGEGRVLAVPAGQSVKRLVFSSDSLSLLTQLADATVACWETATGNPIPLPDSRASPRLVTMLSPNGHYAFVVDSAQSGRLVDVSDRKATTARLQVEGGVQKGVLSGDGRLAAVVDKNNTVWIVETATGKVRGHPLPHAQPVVQVAFNPAGDQVLVAAEDHRTSLWPLSDGWLPLLTLPHGVAPELVQFSPDGRFVAGLGNDGRFRIWNAVTQKPASPPLNPGGALRHIAFCPDGSRLLLVGGDHTVRLWELRACSEAGWLMKDNAGLHPGIEAGFTLPQLSDLVQTLAGARVDEQEHLSSLGGADQLAAWQRFKSPGPAANEE